MKSRFSCKGLHEWFTWFKYAPSAVKPLIAAISVLSFGVSFTSNPLTVVLTDRGLKESMAVIITVYSAAGVCFGLFGGRMTSRFGGKRVALCALPLMLIGAIGTAWAGSTSEFLLVRLIHGASYAVVFPPLTTLLSAHLEHLKVDGEIRTKIHSGNSGFETFAGTLGYFAALGLLEFKCETFWKWGGIVPLLIAFVFLLPVRNFKKGNEQTARTPLRVLGKVLRVTSISVGMMAAHRVVLLYLPLYAGEMTAGVVMLLATCINIATNQWVSNKASRHGHYKLLRVAVWLVFVSLLAIWVSQKIPVVGIAILLMAGVILGVAMRINATSVRELAESAVDDPLDGRAMAMRTMVNESGIMAGKAYGGTVANVLGSAAIWPATIPVLMLSFAPMWGRRR